VNDVTSSVWDWLRIFAVGGALLFSVTMLG
jgi:hypothetical protein